MRTKIPLTLALSALLILIASGCNSDENRRLADLAERQLERQHEQNQRITEMQHEVAEGSRQLVEADAQARKEMISLQKDVQTERATVGQQRDALEQDRRDFASQRHRDPIIAESIKQIGLIAACLLPLIICWWLLRQPVEPANDQVLSELLISELTAVNPLLLPSDPPLKTLEDRERTALPEPSDDDVPAS